jgi:hypothetical protein
MTLRRPGPRHAVIGTCVLAIRDIQDADALLANGLGMMDAMAREADRLGWSPSGCEPVRTQRTHTQEKSPPPAAELRAKGLKSKGLRSPGKTHPNDVAAIIGVDPVAEGAAGVALSVVPRAAPDHTD